MKRPSLPFNLAPVVGMAILVRLAPFYVFRHIFDFSLTGQIHGSIAYDTYAVHLLETGVFGQVPGIADAMIPPVYAYVVAGIYALFGRSALPVVLLNIALDVVSIVLLADLGRRLFPHGAAVGLAAALAAAFYPYLIFQTLTLIDTPIFAALLNSFIWVIVVLRERTQTNVSALAFSVLGGLALGLATLTRPILAPFVVLLPVWFVLRLTWKDMVLRLVPVALVAATVIGAWTYRNYSVYGRFLPITSTAGSNLWQGNNPLVVPLLRAGYDVQWTAPDSLTEPDPRSAEADTERFHLALDYLRQAPSATINLWWTKFLTQWSIDVAPRFNPSDRAGSIVPIPGRAEGFQVPELQPTDPINLYSEPLFDRIGRWVHRVYWGSLLILALVGSLLATRAWREVSIIWFVELSMTVAYVIFHPATRYRAPGDPLLFLLSAHAIVWIAQRMAAPRSLGSGSAAQ